MSGRFLVISCIFSVSLGNAIVSRPLVGAEQQADSMSWPQFLGPDRTGISQETGLLSHWPQGGPKEVWRKVGGVGMSGLAIQGDRLVTLVQRQGKQWLIALNRSTGEELWQTELAPEYRNSMGNGPRATPAISGNRVFSFTGEGILTASNLATGKTEWSKSVVTELRGTVAEYGMVSSPLVVNGCVIVTAGAPQAAVAALDESTGKLVWKAGNAPAGYSSPTLLRLGGKRQLVVFTGASVLGLQPTDGAILWSYEFPTNFDCNIAVPLAIQDHVFISSGENHGAVMLALEPQQNRFNVREQWSSLGAKSTMRNEWQTSIHLGGYLYGMDNVGAAGPVTHLTCIKAETGERVWQKVRFGKGNLIAADGKLFIATMAGELVVVRASPEKYDELGRVVLLGPMRQAPSLANGLLYLRDDEQIACFDVREAR